MKEISSAANLSRVYTNHSVRATAITLWANAGLTNREIMAISGHRNESSLQSYHNMPSAHQLRKCSDVLSLALGEDQSNEEAPNQLVVRPPLQQLQVPSINTSMSTISRARRSSSSCSIYAWSKMLMFTITSHKTWLPVKQLSYKAFIEFKTCFGQRSSAVSRSMDCEVLWKISAWRLITFSVLLYR